MNNKQLKIKRIELDLTQSELAEILDVKPNTVSRWETGLLKLPKVAELAMRTVEREIDVLRQTGLSVKKGMLEDDKVVNVSVETNNVIDILSDVETAIVPKR